MILNLILLALPALAIVCAHVAINVAMRREADSYSTDPVVYQTEFVGFSGSLWPMFVYFAAPNVVLLVYLANRVRSQAMSSR